MVSAVWREVDIIVEAGERARGLVERWRSAGGQKVVDDAEGLLGIVEVG